ncbi:hypothetical protein NPIL_619431 [Nephila pilipes]|uniref:Mos1 transposase HTH domain-containing protein n=1 Tax=Nephila pilipes TaxID=299642 RepID=A0A8X6Q9P0_NEPPI|nr:hypothetical protein NPIL_619431 [Nephila pilipes]
MEVFNTMDCQHDGNCCDIPRCCNRDRSARRAVGTNRTCQISSALRLSEIMEISEICMLMKYEFHLGATTWQAIANINSVSGIQVATNATVARWFKKFRSGDLDLSNEPCGRP